MIDEEEVQVYPLEQAYNDLGLSNGAHRSQVEQRYQKLTHRLYLRKLQGSLTMLDEIKMRTVNQAYRRILQFEFNQQIEAYRVKHYGKYRQYSHLAEKIDHFLFYYKPYVIACVLLLFVMVTGVIGFRMLNYEQSVLASLPEPDLLLIVSTDNIVNLAATELAIKQQLLPMMPEWTHIESKLLNNQSMMILTEKPDLYIVGQDQFIRLLRLGYLRKLELWDTYGINLSLGKLPTMLQLGNQPLIAAVGVHSPHPEHAIQLIQRLYDDTITRNEVNKILAN